MLYLFNIVGTDLKQIVNLRLIYQDRESQSPSKFAGVTFIANEDLESVHSPVLSPRASAAPYIYFQEAHQSVDGECKNIETGQLHLDGLADEEIRQLISVDYVRDDCGINIQTKPLTRKIVKLAKE